MVAAPQMGCGMKTVAQLVGRTPWSARVPLDPLFHSQNRPTRASAADQGVRPTARCLLLMIGLAASLHATTFYVTVAGLGGEQEYEQRFASEAQEMDKLLRAGNPDAKVQTLSGAQATKAQVQSALAGVAKEAK